MKTSDLLKREMKKSNGSVRVVDVDSSQKPTLESMIELWNNVWRPQIIDDIAFWIFQESKNGQPLTTPYVYSNCGRRAGRNKYKTYSCCPGCGKHMCGELKFDNDES